MKNVITIMMIVLLILFMACGQDKSGPQKSLEEIKAEFDNVGLLHNAELEEIHKLFRESNEPLTEVTARALVDAHLAQYCSRNTESVSELTLLLNNIKILAKAANNNEVIAKLADSLEIYSNYKEVFDSIAFILDSELRIQDKVKNLESIYLFIDENVYDIEDRQALLSGLSTTIHSVPYWDENFGDWQQTLDSSMAKTTIGLAGAIGLIDGAGAVVGTIEGFRDIPKGTDKRGLKIVRRAAGEGVKTSAFTLLSVLLL